MTLEEITTQLEEIRNEVRLVESGYYKNMEEASFCIGEINTQLNTLIYNINLEIWKQSINNLK